MSQFTFETSQEIASPLEDVFDFFSRAENLERITPPHLRFKILTSSPISMAEGTRIEYQIRLFSLPFRWLTEITAWRPRKRFEDTQLRGPYRKWVHEHEFAATPHGTLMRDRVCYELPFGPIGRLLHRLFIRRQIEAIFAYRQQVIGQLFAEAASK